LGRIAFVTQFIFVYRSFCFFPPLHPDVSYNGLYITNKALFNRSEDVWNIKEISDALWAFQFLYKSLTLILKLNPCEMKDSGKAVTDIQLISHATGE
jgi:hypothetical protein